MNYQVVFEFKPEGTDWSFALFILGLAAVTVLFVVFRKRLFGGNRPHTADIAFLFCFFAIALSVALLSHSSTSRENEYLRTAVKNNHVKIAEGVVAKFKPMPFNGHTTEKFCVADVCFEYSDYIASSAFNNTASHGGPIREGLQVRVTYVGNAIVKLEVETPGP